MKTLISLMVVIFVTTVVSADDNQKSITVSGTAVIEVPADEINWDISIRKISDSLEDSKNDCNTAVNNLLEVLNASGIKKSDIEVSPIQLNKYFEQNEYRERIFKGFTAGIKVKFRLKDLSGYSNLVTQLSKSNDFERVNSSYKDSKYEEHNREALIKAAITAKEKAEYLAQSLGSKIVIIIEIIEATGQKYPNPFNSSTYLEGFKPVISGRISYRRSVTVKYELITEESNYK